MKNYKKNNVRSALHRGLVGKILATSQVLNAGGRTEKEKTKKKIEEEKSLQRFFVHKQQREYKVEQPVGLLCLAVADK